MKDQFLREKIVRLAHSNPQLRKHLLPLVNGKVASDESLELRVTKLAYANPELREHLVPLIKQASFFKKIMEKIKKMFFKNKETGNKVKFDSLPQEQKKEITEKAKEDAKKEQEKADESKEEEKSEQEQEETAEPKSEEKSESKEEPKSEKKEESKSEKKEEPKSESKEEEKSEKKDESNPYNRSKIDQAMNILKNFAKESDMSESKFNKIKSNLEKSSDRDIQSYINSMKEYETEEDTKVEFKSEEELAEIEDRKKAPKDRSPKSKMKALESVLDEDKIKSLIEEVGLTGYKKGVTERALRSLLKGENVDGKVDDVYKEIEKKSKGSVGGEVYEKILKEMDKELGPGEKKASLKSQLVRLAYQNPSLRADILPLITKSAKGDYKKGDKIPPRAVYGSKDSYDEKLKDGKIFVVLPRESKNSDPFMMYLTDSSLKVLKVLGTHPTMRGAKAWLKSQKGKLASTRVAKLRVGQTWESNTIRAHRYHDSIKVWDLKHAGKRGKNVEIMNIHITEWKKPNKDRAYLDDVSDFLTSTTTYDHFKKIVISFLKTAGFTNVVGNRESIISFREEKGVRISPPNMGKIEINNRFVSAWFELGEFHIQDKTDQHNLPTMMERDRRSPPKLYKMVAGNKAMFENMNYKEMRQFLIDYKINFRTYMGMD